MANEIVKLVAKKANISEPIAQIAVDTVLTAIKSKLPAAAGGIIDTFLSSGVTIPTSKSSSKAPAKTTKTPAKTTKAPAKNAKKDNNPLGGLGDIATSVLGSLLGSKK
ncbi:MAG: hypothetical protein LBI82_01610 [Dysgonamonadaceae bacterium]|nr:hypothetical protein [Dysgonamonadaceae bacterium]